MKKKNAKKLLCFVLVCMFVFVAFVPGVANADFYTNKPPVIRFLKYDSTSREEGIVLALDVYEIYGKPNKNYTFYFWVTDLNPQDWLPMGIYYFMDWGDGNNTGWVLLPSDQPKIRHKWADPGEYNIVLKVKDKKGAVAEKTKHLTIIAPRVPYIKIKEPAWGTCITGTTDFSFEVDADWIVDTHKIVDPYKFYFGFNAIGNGFYQPEYVYRTWQFTYDCVKNNELKVTIDPDNMLIDLSGFYGPGYIGLHVLRICVVDKAGYVGYDEIPFFVDHNGDHIVHPVEISKPVYGESVSGVLNMTFYAGNPWYNEQPTDVIMNSWWCGGLCTDNLGFDRAEIFIDGAPFDMFTDPTKSIHYTGHHQEKRYSSIGVLLPGLTPYHTGGFYDYELDTTKLSNGEHTIEIQAFDTSGRVSKKNVMIFVDNPVDTTPPTVTITSPVDGAVVSDNVAISVDAFDDEELESVEFFIDGSYSPTFTDYTAPYQYSWNTFWVYDGTHTIKAVASDISGNTAEHIVSVIVDNSWPPYNSPPTVDISNPLQGDVVSDVVVISGSASDDDGDWTVEKVEVKIDDGSWNVVVGTTSWTMSWDTTVVDDGSHIVYARSYDGTEYSSVASVQVTVDNHGGGGGSRELSIVNVDSNLGSIFADIENTGELLVENISWSINVTGGIRNLIKKNTSGSITSLDVGLNTTISTDGLILGLGYADVVIRIAADDMETIVYETEAFVLGPFIIVM